MFRPLLRDALPYFVHTCKCRWTGYGFRALSLKQGIRFHLWLAASVGCLVRRNPLRECESFGDETSTFGANNFCFSKKFKSMTLLWKITRYNFYAEWNETGPKKLGLLSYTGIAEAKWIISVSNRVRVWRPGRHTSTPTALEGPRALLIKGRRKIDYLYFAKLEILLRILVWKYSVADNALTTQKKKKPKQNKKKKNSSRAPHEKKTMLHVFCLLWRYAKHRSQEVPIATMGHYSILNEFLKNSNWFSPMKRNNYLILIRKLIWRDNVFLRLN